MPWFSELSRTLQKFGAKPARAERWPLPGFSALCGPDFPDIPVTIKNISSSGIYIGLVEPIPVGQLVNLELRMEGDAKQHPELETMVRARVARRDESGAGLAFVLPQGLDPALWEVLIRGIAILADRDQVADLFRALRTVLFLCRLCPDGAEEAILLLDGRLDRERMTTLAKIVSEAEDRLLAEPGADDLRADPKLMEHLLRNGSWAPDALTMLLWVGLLVSSCSTATPGDANRILADLLIHITPHQARILLYACEHALNHAPALGNALFDPVILYPHEIVKVTGVTDLSRNATDLAYLFNLGLIANLFDFTSYREIDRFDITPSRLGIALYSHCQGKRNAIDPQLVEAAERCLAAMFPPPLPCALENFTPLAPDSSRQT